MLVYASYAAVEIGSLFSFYIETAAVCESFTCYVVIELANFAGKEIGACMPFGTTERLLGTDGGVFDTSFE